MHSIDERPSSILQQIKARRLEEEEGEFDRPLSSYRASRMNQSGDSGYHNKVGESGQVLQLRRQELYRPALVEKTQNVDNRLKYRYDIGKDVQQDNVKSYLEEVPLQKYGEIPSSLGLSNLIKPRQINSGEREGYSIGGSNRSKEIKSIIFDSKVSKFEPFQSNELQSRMESIKSKEIQMKLEPYRSKQIQARQGLAQVKQDWNASYDSQLDIFKRKVGKVNSEIEAGIDNLQAMIAKLKQKKVQQSKVQSRIPIKGEYQGQRRGLNPKIAESMMGSCLAKQVKQIETISKPTYPKASQSNYVKQSVVIGSTIGLDKRDKIKEPQQPIKIQQLGNSQQVPLQAAPGQTITISSSNIRLSSDPSMTLVYFPPQYTSFINRLSNQIQLDWQFTSMMITLSKQKQLDAVRNLIVSQIAKYKGDLHVNQSFFKVQSQQFDPLDQNKMVIVKSYTEQQLKQQAFRAYKKYKQCDNHFELKLRNGFNPQIVDMLFQDLVKFNFTKQSLNDSHGVTVGHLLSYLNMRTSRNFRNRFFVKMLKRLGMKSNTPIQRGGLDVFCK